MSDTNSRPVLVLTDSRTVHVSTCWQARRDGGTRARYDVENSHTFALEVATSDLRPCKKCKPISRLTWWERSHK